MSLRIQYACWCLLLLLPAMARAQQHPSVSGIVQNDQNERMIGVSVKATDTRTGRISAQMTNEKGLFTFNDLVPGDTYQFAFSYVGYKNQVLDGYSIKKDETINLVVHLKIKDDALAQVVVVGYGTQKKSNVTGAISQVGSEVFENRPVTNIAQALQGALPNVNVTFGDGQIGRGGTFNIRGFTSLNGGGPLVLIDGTPGDINLINPEDVESVTALKDAASAAIYGARAAFGVLLVTTRHGRKDHLQVRYTNNFGWGQPTRLPHVIKDPLAAAQLQNQAYRDYAGSDAAGMADVIAYLQKRKADPSLPELGVDASGNFIRGANTDWYSAFYNNRQPFQKHYVSISGGKDKTEYFLSLGYLNQDGSFKAATDNYKRYNLQFKLNQEVTKWFSFNDNTELIQGVYDAPNKFLNTAGNNLYRYLSLFANPYEAIHTPDGNYTQAGALTFGALEKGGRSLEKDQVLKNTLGFHTQFLNNSLHVNGDYSVFVSQDRGQLQGIPIQYETKPGTVVTYSNPDFYRTAFLENFDQNANLYADYEKRFGNGHHFKALVGMNQEWNTFNADTAMRKTNVTANEGSLNLTTGVATVSDQKSKWVTRGLFYRLGYDFKDRYLLEFNGREDATSRFASNHRRGFFPSASAGWVVSKENFFKPVEKIINSLKLRASYGSLGNQLVSDYAYINAMKVGQITDILDGAQPTAIYAPNLTPYNLTWETATTKDFGADIALLDSRLHVGYDWYDRKTTKMLTKGRTLPAVLGTTAPQQNAADLDTRGWELSVKWDDQFQLAGKPFSYGASVVLSDSRSFITRYDNPSKLLTDYYVGMQLGEIWGYTTDGFFQSDDEYKGHADQRKVQSTSYSLNGHPLAGDLKFRDVNGDGVIYSGTNTVGDPGDKRIIGNSMPHYAYGVDLNFNWNGIGLNTFFQGIGKRDFWPGAESGIFWGFYNRWNQPVYDHINNNYWTPTHTDAYFPRPRAYDALSDTRQLGVVQTRYLQNAAYLRLKNVTLSYTLPVHWTESIKMSNARIFFSGQNLFEWTKLSKAFDPEGTGDEVDGVASNPAVNGNGFVYPIQRTYTFGLEVNF